jgi:hypothetical protein
MLKDEQLEELADEAVAGFEKLLDAEALQAVRHLFIDLYAVHPVMRALGTEHFGDRVPKQQSEETEIGQFDDLDALRKKYGRG